MINNQIFAWENYEENPNKMIGVDTIPTQKDATYNEVSNGVFTGSMAESFFTNVDKATVPQVASVIGMEPGEIVYGSKDGMVMVEFYRFTSYSAETGGDKWGEGKVRVIKKDNNNTYVKVVENSTPEFVGNEYYVMSTEIPQGRLQLYTMEGSATGIWVEIEKA